MTQSDRRKGEKRVGRQGVVGVGGSILGIGEGGREGRGSGHGQLAPFTQSKCTFIHPVCFIRDTFIRDSLSQPVDIWLFVTSRAQKIT